MIIVAISHRNRQQRRAMARALEKQVARATGAQVRAHFMALSNYLRDAAPAALELLGLADHADHALLGYVTDQAHDGEKVDLIGYRNLPANFERAQTEMLAQIARARGTDPIEHYVISWGDEEHPTPEQVDEAVALLMRVLRRTPISRRTGCCIPGLPGPLRRSSEIQPPRTQWTAWRRFPA